MEMDMYQGKILIFGAGATGRGHLAELLYRDGCRNITFVDKKPKLVDQINREGKYPVRLLTDNETPGTTVVVQGINAIHRTDETAIENAFCESLLVLTAVIAENLPDIAAVVARCVRRRMALKDRREMNVVCCENLDHASSWLKEMVYEKLSPEEKAYCDAWVGFPDAMISRVVPVPPEDSLDIVTEDYNEWTVDAFAFLCPHPEIPSIDLVNNLNARLERKLWTHNGGHATLAYAAVHKGYPYIHTALEDPELAAFTVAVLDEIGDCVYHKYSREFTLPQVRQYEADLGARGAIAEMKDEISRVVRDPLRKLNIHDRLLAPALYAAQNGLGCENLCKSIVNATRYCSEKDPESVQMQALIGEKGYPAFIREVLGLKICPALAEKIIKLYEEETR